MSADFFHMEHATVVDTTSVSQIAQQFIAGHLDDIFTDTVELTVSNKVPLPDILLKLKSVLDTSSDPDLKPRLVMMDTSNTVITGGHVNERALVIVTDNNPRHRGEVTEVHSLKVQIFSSNHATTAIKAAIEGLFDKERMAKVKWWYEGQHGVDVREIYLPPSKINLFPEYYPDLGDPQAFMDDFLASEASVLLLAGDPGTGKTTLLRQMIVERKLVANVIYDEKLMEKDSIFQSFLFDEGSDIMVIEDADTILTSRERDGNKMMARFLSVSDGLIKLPNKKLVFTTNISDYQRVDEALLRPGRCYGVINTRPLDLQEAQLAAKVGGLPIPLERRQYTIAELFNQGRKSNIRTAGFGVRH